MLSRSSASGSLSALLPDGESSSKAAATRSMKNDEVRNSQAANNTRATRREHDGDCEIAEAQDDAPADTPPGSAPLSPIANGILPQRPGFPRQQSASSAKSITSRLTQTTTTSSAASSASSGKTIVMPDADLEATQGSQGNNHRWSTGSGSGTIQQLPASVNKSTRHSSGPGGPFTSRVSTRPSNRRASSYNTGAASANKAHVHRQYSPPLRSSGLPQPAEKLESLLPTPAAARGHSSSISLPLSPEDATRQHCLVQQRMPSSLRTEWKDSSNTAEAGPSGMPIPDPGSAAPRRKWSSDGYEHSGDNDFASDPSAPSSFASQNGFYQPFPHNAGQPSTSYAPHSPNILATSVASGYSFPMSLARDSSSPPRARDYALMQDTQLQAHISPLTASNIRAKGKERSRQTSGSSHLEEADASVDIDPDTGTDLGTTDLASDAGNTGWDVRETDKLRSAKDAQGRKMINQYARVAEIGRGVHGRVWLCEDTETGEFHAIKCVNRENKKMKSLKRSQAESEAHRRRLSDGDEDSHGHHAPDERDSNTSFDNVMQLNDISADLQRQRSSNRKKPIVMDEKVKQEIAIMKRCHHEHVVQLREVIDDRRSKKIFMVLEYMPGGQIDWTKDNQPAMTVDESRRVFRDVVLGLEYLHYQGIIHRDIKPANLLWTQDRDVVKISDFGVSHVSEALARSSAADPSGGKVNIVDDRALRKTEGSPAFFAPELCAATESTPVATPVNEIERTASRPDYFRRQSSLSNERQSVSSRSADFPGFSPSIPSSSLRPTPVNRASTMTITTISPPLSAQQQQAHRIRARERPIIGKGIDIWALGVTLYCLLFGFTPFHEATSEYELYNMIPKKDIAIPPTMGSDRLRTGSGLGQDSLDSSKDLAEGREVVDLLARLLEKDPTKRIQLHEVKKHPWVLRNLENSQGWLREHDLAETRVVSVTEEEVQHATAERTKPQETTGIKASFKRFGEMFGLGGQSFLRKSARRDRSKSASSTSASITTASAWDGKSEHAASRTASRQPSIVKKKPSAYSTRSVVDEGAASSEALDTDPNGLMSHALALKRKLANAKAAREAHEAALSVSGNSPPDRIDAMSQQHRQQALSRSLSGESSGTRSSEHGAEPSRRQSLGHLLQPPPAMQRRPSGGPLELSRHSTFSDTPAVSQPGSTRPSLSSSSSRPASQHSVSKGDSDQDGQLTGRLRNMWQKIRTGSRTPAPGTPRSKSSAPTPAVQRGQVRALSSSGGSRAPALTLADRTLSADQAVGLMLSPGSTRRPSADYPIFSPASSDSRPSSQDTDPEARPDLVSGDLSAKLLAAAAVPGRLPPNGKASYIPQHGGPALADDVISDSSDSSLDDFDDDEDYGEALSPLDAEEQEGSTQPSSYGHPPAPIMWSDASQGWQASNGLSADPLGRFFRQQQSSRSVEARESAEIRQSDPPAVSETTTRADKPLRPPISRDGSIHKDFTARVPPASPGHQREIGNVADDENDEDDDEEEEVMIKPRSRLRRGTNASNQGSAPSTARPSMPTSPRQSHYHALPST